MNLAFITIKNPYGPRPYGGAEISTRILAEKMAARGHRVFFLAERAGPHARGIANSVGVDLRSLPRLPARKLQSVQAITRVLYIQKIADLVRRHGIDLIYCFYELPVLEAALHARQRLGRPKVVMRMAGLKWRVDSAREPGLQQRYEAAFREVDSVNFVVDGLPALTEQIWDEWNIPMRFRSSFVQDVGSLASPKRDIAYADLPPTPFRIVMAARFSDYQKRQDLLIRAAALLPRDVPVEITLVGSGVRLPEMQALAQQLDVTDRLVFLPFLDQAALWARFQRTHLMCHATDFEGLSKVIAEGMIMGLPVLTSDVAPLNGYIRDGENGFLVANTPEAWAARIMDLSGRRGELGRASETASAFAVREWDADLGADAYEERFASLLRAHR